MSAYVVVDIEVIDPVRYEDYKRLAHAAVTAWGGRYVARGGSTEVLEGDWQPRRLVLLEFPTVQQAKAWWASDEYGPAKKLRQETARTNMVVIEGM
jgi:uncharacterized protein (DUF1330 family)